METEGIGGSAYVAVIKQILDLLKVQHKQSPASKVSRLIFWDDGMLRDNRGNAGPGM
jgi:hypothetical protein